MDARTRFAFKCAAAMGCGVLVGGFGIFGVAWAFLGVSIAKKQLDAEEMAEIPARLQSVGIGPVELLQVATTLAEGRERADAEAKAAWADGCEESCTCGVAAGEKHNHFDRLPDRDLDEIADVMFGPEEEEDFPF